MNVSKFAYYQIILFMVCSIVDAAHHKTILVTGGAGFVGSHLCTKLLELGYQVIALDNLYTGSKKIFKTRFIFMGSF